jgi:hypothetical protein
MLASLSLNVYRAEQVFSCGDTAERSAAKPGSREARATRASEVIDCLSSTKTRATYSAVASVLGCDPAAAAQYLGTRRPAASWIVNAETGEPTGYTRAQIDPDLYKATAIIRTGRDLGELIRQWRQHN